MCIGHLLHKYCEKFAQLYERAMVNLMLKSRDGICDDPSVYQADTW